MCFPACFRMTLISKGNQRKEMRLSSPTEGSLKALQIQTILAERLRGCFFALSTKSMERKPLLISSKSSASLASKYYSKEDLPQPLQTLTLQMKGHKKCILSWKKPIQGSMSSLTHTKIMADSGARGNIINMAQMAACVGQQAMRGKRIEKGYTTRTMSCFRKGDLKPAA